MLLKRVGEDFELGALGDGYQSTTTWVIDLISWKMLHKPLRDLNGISGIVIIDEIEKHLHPRWQLTILSMLREAFPKVQFIATTHSPLVISGSHGIPVLPLNRKPYKLKTAEGWLAEDVYRDVKGLPTSRNEEFDELIRQYQKIDAAMLFKGTSELGKKEMASIRKTLRRALPGDDPVMLSTELTNLKEYVRASRTNKTK